LVEVFCYGTGPFRDLVVPVPGLNRSGCVSDNNSASKETECSYNIWCGSALRAMGLALARPHVAVRAGLRSTTLSLNDGSNIFIKSTKSIDFIGFYKKCVFDVILGFFIEDRVRLLRHSALR